MGRGLAVLTMLYTTLFFVETNDAHPAEAASPCVRGTNVLVIGDSLTVSTVKVGRLSSRLCDAGFQSTLLPENGLATWRATEMLRDAVSRGDVGPVVVAALGTNDAKFAVSSDLFSRQVDAFVSAARGRTVLWINLRTRVFSSDSARLNRVLASKARSNQQVVVLDWASNPFSSALVSDGIHLTPRASVARAKFMTDKVAAWSETEPREGSAALSRIEIE